MPFCCAPSLLFFGRDAEMERERNVVPPLIACYKNGRRGEGVCTPSFVVKRSGVGWSDHPSFPSWVLPKTKKGEGGAPRLVYTNPLHFFFLWSNDPEGVCYMRKTQAQIKKTIILGEFCIHLCPFWLVGINPLLKGNSVGSCYIVLETIPRCEHG